MIPWGRSFWGFGPMGKKWVSPFLVFVPVSWTQ
jgi:hypothetical protein